METPAKRPAPTAARIGRRGTHRPDHGRCSDVECPGDWQRVGPFGHGQGTDWMAKFAVSSECFRGPRIPQHVEGCRESRAHLRLRCAYLVSSEMDAKTHALWPRLADPFHSPPPAYITPPPDELSQFPFPVRPWLPEPSLGTPHALPSNACPYRALIVLSHTGPSVHSAPVFAAVHQRY